MWLRTLLCYPGRAMIKRIQQWLYPELMHYSGWFDRQRAIRRASNRSMKRRKIWVSFVIVMLLGSAAPLLIVEIVGVQYFVFPGSPAVFAAYGLFFGAIFGRIQQQAMRKEMRIELYDRGVPICLGCGYDTTGLVGDQCPECGANIKMDQQP